ncbi:hypothetical protein OAP14_03265 [Aliiglaciecola sp.]|nr:hypothetical protein [Aliiglaciecola sp.]
MSRVVVSNTKMDKSYPSFKPWLSGSIKAWVAAAYSGEAEHSFRSEREHQIVPALG